jgi:antitoxin component HigA of HigAB toxin-antitoxin module
MKYVYNGLTGEGQLVELDADDLAAIEIVKAEQAKLEAEAAAKVKAKQAVLDKLGLTADEVAALGL